MAYLLDANVFIQAKNLYYGMDFCPAFWDWLILNNQLKKVFSVEKVGGELEAGEDALADWAKQHGSNFFLKPDSKMVAALGTVSNWVAGKKYSPVGVNVFLQSADYYLIAYALVHKHIVVTLEVPSDSPNKIKIPSVCIGLGVKCMNTYTMLRQEHARFILKPDKIT